MQYFRRSFCAACGAPDPVEKRASGAGTVYATSLVCRAATPETRAHVPYNIVLVDTAEGFRMMAHGDNDLAIGDKVTAQFRAVCREGWCPISRSCDNVQASNAITVRSDQSTWIASMTEPLQ